MKNTILILLFILLSSAVYGQNDLVKINRNRFIERRNKKYGVIDSLKNIIVPFQYDHIDNQNERLIVKSHNTYGLYSLDNEKLLHVTYKFVLPRKKGRFIVSTKTGMCGLSDLNGKIIIPVKYKNLHSIDSNFYISENNRGLNGVYDCDGNNILPEEYKMYTIDEHKIFATKNGKPQIIDILNPENNINLDPDVGFIETFRHYSMDELRLFQIIKKRNHFGLINSKNETIIPVVYDDMRSSAHWGYYIIKKEGKFGLIDIRGRLTKEPIYDSFFLRKESIILKRKGLKNEEYSYEWFKDVP